jgi:hypothetical protein
VPITVWDLGLLMPFLTLTEASLAPVHRFCFIKSIDKAFRLDTLQMWILFDRPDDFPDGFVVRTTYQFERDGFRILYRGNALTAATLDEAIALIPEGAHRREREPEDPPAIVAVWI